MDSFDSCYAKAIRQWRILKQLNQEEAAEYFGVACRTYQRWEYGQSIPSYSRLCQFKQEGMDMNDFF